jgi:3-deoxy-D-manno-octulosonic-acid transferase
MKLVSDYELFLSKFTTLTTHTLNKLSVIATQNQNSAERFIKLGANKDKVMVAGNIKFKVGSNKRE